MKLERTDVAQQDFDRKTGEIPITVSDDERHDMFAAAMDLDNDEPLACGIENPDICESCQ